MKKIITISREFGAGAGEIGKVLASELGYEYYDKALILGAAKEANLDVATAYRWDEAIAPNYGFAQSLFDFYNRSLDEKIFDGQSEIIKKLGEKGKCVIVGRNANTILKHYDNSFHVFFCADREWRIDRMCRLYPETSRKDTIKQLEIIDKRRKKYCSYYTNTEFGNADNYDLCLNTGKLGIEKCTQIVLDIVRG